MLIDSTVSKDFTWNRGFELNWDLTKSLKFDLSVNNHARIDEEAGAYDLFRKGDKSEWSKSVWESIKHGGRPVNYNHSLNATYNVPLNKFPILSWTSMSLRYNSTYEWSEGPIFEGSRTLGNSISNSNTIQASTTFNLTGLYGKVKYLKKLDSKYAGNQKDKTPKPMKTVTFTKENVFLRPHLPRNISHKLKTQDIKVTVTDKDGQEIPTQVEILDDNRVSITADTNYTGLLVSIEGQVAKAQPLLFLGESTIRVLTGLKNVSFTYSLTGGTRMNGFMPAPNIMGFSTADQYSGAPGLPFLIGLQDPDFDRYAAEKGWLTTSGAFNDPFTMSRTENFNAKGTFEPFKGFRIEISGLRTYTDFHSEFFHYSDTTAENKGFSFGNQTVSGGYSISIISIGTGFEKLKSGNGFQIGLFRTVQILSSDYFAQAV